MKKILSAVLAGAMVASMGVASFATSKVKVADVKRGGDAGHPVVFYDNDGIITVESTGKIAYGKTAFYQLVGSGDVKIDAYDAVKSVSIKQSWDMNGSAVSKVEIVKKKYGAGASDYCYWIAVNTKPNSTTSTTDVSGKIEIKKSSPSDYAFGPISFNVSLSVGYANATTSARTIGSTAKVFNFADVKAEDNTRLGSDEEDVIEFDGGYMTVNTVGQSKMLLSVSTKYNADIAAKYPEANLDFVTFNGASFNKIGELTLGDITNGSFLYEVKDGALVAVKASYDEYEESFKIKTRNLGQYVISDVELKTGAIAPESSSSTETGKPNPGTGAIA